MIASVLATIAGRKWEVVAILVLGALAFLLWLADRDAQYRAGQQAERQAAIERANEILKKRAQDDAEIGNLDDGSLCREFGFKLLPDGSCGD